MVVFYCWLLMGFVISSFPRGDRSLGRLMWVVSFLCLFPFSFLFYPSIFGWISSLPSSMYVPSSSFINKIIFANQTNKNSQSKNDSWIMYIFSRSFFCKMYFEEIDLLIDSHMPLNPSSTCTLQRCWKYRII